MSDALPYPAGFAWSTPTLRAGVWTIPCLACRSGRCTLQHVDGHRYTLAQEPCSHGCHPETARASLLLTMGLLPADAAAVIPQAHKYATKLLAAFVRLAEVMPSQFDAAMAAILHDGMTAAGGLISQLDELRSRFAHVTPDAM